MSSSENLTLKALRAAAGREDIQAGMTFCQLLADEFEVTRQVPEWAYPLALNLFRQGANDQRIIKTAFNLDKSKKGVRKKVNPNRGRQLAYSVAKVKLISKMNGRKVNNEQAFAIVAEVYKSEIQTETGDGISTVKTAWENFGAKAREQVEEDLGSIWGSD